MHLSFKHEEFQLLDWLNENVQRAKFNLASSGVEAPNLEEFGIETNPNSLVGLRTAKLEESLGRVYGVPTDEVLTCGGSTMSIFLAISSIVKSGDEVVIPMPNYPPEYKVTRILGAKVREIGSSYEDSFRLNIGSILNAISGNTKLVVLTNSNNPTGLKISKKDLEEIIDFAARKDVLVFVDETFREFADDPAPMARLFGDNVIVASSMTKYYGLGDIRVGWLVAEKTILERIKALNKWVSIEIARLSYMIAIEALEKKKLFDERTRSLTRQNLLLGREFMRNNSQYLEWVEPDGAPFGFPKVKMPFSSVDLCKILIDRFGVLVGPGEFFEYPGHFRLCLTRSPEKTKQGLEALSAALSTVSTRVLD